MPNTLTPIRLELTVNTDGGAESDRFPRDVIDFGTVAVIVATEDALDCAENAERPGLTFTAIGWATLAIAAALTCAAVALVVRGCHA